MKPTFSLAVVIVIAALGVTASSRRPEPDQRFRGFVVPSKQVELLAPLGARLNLPVELFGDLEVGKRYTLVASEPINGDLTATLKLINPIIDTASQTFLCVFTIGNPDVKLPAGFTVYLGWPGP